MKEETEKPLSSNDRQINKSHETYNNSGIVVKLRSSSNDHYNGLYVYRLSSLTRSVTIVPGGKNLPKNPIF